MSAAASTMQLTEAVEVSPRLRRAYRPGIDRGPFIITGHPRNWGAAANAVHEHGGTVIAYQDMRRRPRRLWFSKRPVISGRALGPLAPLSILFAGSPTKFWFNKGTDALERCLWHQPPSGWRARGRRIPDLLRQHGDALATVFASLHDDASRRTYASLVRGRIEGCTDYYRVSRYREYDHPYVGARPGEVVIDAGAYDGDSARAFAWHMRGRGKIIALEPSPVNFAKLARRWIPGLYPVCAGAWHREQTLEFNDDGGSGRLKASGGMRVKVVAIDELVRELRLERVDLLKFDVEGAEAEALRGCKATIVKHRPKLQISIYHHDDDLFSLPLLLQSWLKGYRYYIGHHNFYHTETDLYAVPIERT